MPPNFAAQLRSDIDRLVDKPIDCANERSPAFEREPCEAEREISENITSVLVVGALDGTIAAFYNLTTTQQPLTSVPLAIVEKFASRLLWAGVLNPDGVFEVRQFDQNNPPTWD